MQKLPSPPDDVQLTEIEAILRKLHERRQVVNRLIRQLEQYAALRSRQEAYVPAVTSLGLSQHIH